MRQHVINQLLSEGLMGGWAPRAGERAGYKCEYCDKDMLASTTALHEIGHVLGIGTVVFDNSGFVQDLNGDVHFNGPRAIAAFDDAGGRNYTGKKVPLEEDSAHWRFSVLRGELMGAGNSLSAITIQDLADLGYSVDVTQADPHTLPRAAAKVLASERTCGAGHRREPIHVVDPQGRVVGTLHR